MAVHGGVLPLMFDSVFGMVIHGAGRPISRTGFLHVDYRKVTPIDMPLTATRLDPGDRGAQGVRQLRTARPRRQAAAPRRTV